MAKAMKGGCRSVVAIVAGEVIGRLDTRQASPEHVDVFATRICTHSNLQTFIHLPYQIPSIAGMKQAKISWSDPLCCGYADFHVIHAFPMA
jgi:hypothetical protein